MQKWKMIKKNYKKIEKNNVRNIHYRVERVLRGQFWDKEKIVFQDR